MSINEYGDFTCPRPFQHTPDVVHRIITSGQPVAERARKLAGKKRKRGNSNHDHVHNSPVQESIRESDAYAAQTIWRLAAIWRLSQAERTDSTRRLLSTADLRPIPTATQKIRFHDAGPAESFPSDSYDKLG